MWSPGWSPRASGERTEPWVPDPQISGLKGRYIALANRARIVDHGAIPFPHPAASRLQHSSPRAPSSRRSAGPDSRVPRGYPERDRLPTDQNRWNRRPRPPAVRAVAKSQRGGRCTNRKNRIFAVAQKSGGSPPRFSLAVRIRNFFSQRVAVIQREKLYRRAAEAAPEAGFSGRATLAPEEAQDRLRRKIPLGLRGSGLSGLGVFGAFTQGSVRSPGPRGLHPGLNIFRPYGPSDSSVGRICRQKLPETRRVEKKSSPGAGGSLTPPWAPHLPALQAFGWFH
jgi:hypothetical protein